MIFKRAAMIVAFLVPLSFSLLCTKEEANPAGTVVKNLPPQFLMGYTDTAVVAGKTISLQVLCKDDDNDSVKISIVKAPAGAAYDSVKAFLNWRTDRLVSSLGKYTTIFRATDKKDTTLDTITITVQSGTPPVFTCKDSIKINGGYATSYQLTATDLDKDVLKYFRRSFFDTTITVDSLSGLLKWKPPVSLVNTQSVCTLFVTDGLTEDTMALKIGIYNAGMLRVPGASATIQGAIDKAKSGDTIIVDTGTYRENISYKGKLLILASRYFETGDTALIGKTIINGQSKAPVVMISNGEPAGTRLCGFTLTDGRGNGNQGGGVHISRCPVIIDHCTIKDSRSEGG